MKDPDIVGFDSVRNMMPFYGFPFENVTTVSRPRSKRKMYRVAEHKARFRKNHP